MRTKRSHEGVLIVDHRSTVGLTAEDVHKVGLPPGTGTGFREVPTYTCSHCQVVVVMNPDRSRERAWCRHCDHYICDKCGAELQRTKKCKTFKQVIEETQEMALKGGL